MHDPEFIDSCITSAQSKSAGGSPASITSTAVGEPYPYADEVKDNPKGMISPSPSAEVRYPGAFSDFYGLPSNPVCVYRTGDEWSVPEGPEAQRVPRDVGPVFNHPVMAAWKTLGRSLYKYLDTVPVYWTSIDGVYFNKSEPLYLWIAVMPGSLSLVDAKVVGAGCKDLLSAAQFPDIEIAFREAMYKKSSGPRLLSYVPPVEKSDDHTAHVRVPFTGTLGVPIALRNNPNIEGTGALYLREGGASDRVFLLTARHVCLPQDKFGNRLYDHRRNSQPRHEVILLGHDALKNSLEDMLATIGGGTIMTEYYQEQLDSDTLSHKKRQDYMAKKIQEQEKIEAVDRLHTQVTKQWTVPSQRIFGQVAHSPPISVDTEPKGYTEDWALVEIDRSKINWDDFKGNAIYLGNKIDPVEFVLKMHPHPESRPSFKYPSSGLLQVRGVVPEDEIHKPLSRDANGESCLIVIKNGRSTGVTIGRASGMESFVREYSSHGIKSTSMEIAVHPYNRGGTAFSACGDSGSIVVDGLGRIVGLLTGGSGLRDSTDVSYLTPYFWLEERIKEAFPGSHLYPIQN